ncbi:unnamed protein product [Heligmosomoides polygyrus]|uniref:DUF148 domain-containing protein n=1 Tax=Heligmosomoides polygyrus TaxID=6339 RepID=A0A183F892_HELPZ|nr:unnamed protein product [Heligmosomoides polygyrus]
MNTAVLVVVLCAALCDAHRGRDRGYYSGGQRRRGPPIPPYLKYVSREARREYSNIVTSTDKTIADKKQEIIEWGQKYGIQDKVKDFNEKVESIRSQMMQNATELIKALPTALEQFSAIKKNKDQTSSQRDKALEELRASDPRVYDVLQYIFQQFKPGDPHGRRGYQGIDGFGRLGDLCRLSG